MLVISFCEQTDAVCRGYACDDHISKNCYTTTPTIEQLAIIRDLLKQVEEISTRKRQTAVNLWKKRHIGVTECLCEGEEFIGLKWIECTEYKSTTPATTPADEIVKYLQDLLVELTTCNDDIPTDANPDLACRTLTLD